jgi:hypothetical protein
MKTLNETIKNVMLGIKEQSINEGTTATITVFDGKKYKTSLLQYDGQVEIVGRVLIKSFYSAKAAAKLVKKSGELASIDPIEYYSDTASGRQGSILKVTTKESEAIKNANGFEYAYYWDGQDWFVDKNLTTFDNMDMLDIEY